MRVRAHIYDINSIKLTKIASRYLLVVLYLEGFSIIFLINFSHQFGNHVLLKRKRMGKPGTRPGFHGSKPKLV